MLDALPVVAGPQLMAIFTLGHSMGFVLVAPTSMYLVSGPKWRLFSNCFLQSNDLLLSISGISLL